MSSLPLAPPPFFPSAGSSSLPPPPPPRISGSCFTVWAHPSASLDPRHQVRPLPLSPLLFVWQDLLPLLLRPASILQVLQGP
ncbi:hypothetical protein DAI22_01g427100 [Oryza sativa Japonica Group]|nr:hypothetical protein DAI22_01g427100 [Oryza sativa Japonica Group]